MSSVAVSRPNYTSKKNNKENAQPGQAGPGKSFVKREVSKFTKPAAPLQLKGNEKETGGNAVSFKAADKQADTMSVSSVSSSKSAPGMYKGKIVQSKIGSLWKSSASVSRAEPRPAAPKAVGQKTGNLTKSRSESGGDVPGRGSQKPAPSRFKSVSNGHVHMSKAAASTLPKSGLASCRPPVRTVPGTLRSASSRNTTAAPTKRSGIQNAQPKIPVTDKKVNKPSMGSSLSQYRSTETLEERRAKLAEWLASKGKTLKRPAMTASATAKTKICVKPKVDVKPQSPSHGENLQAEAQQDPEPCVEAQNVDSAAEPCAEPQVTASVTLSRTPVIMDISLDLLESEDEELQDSVDDIIVNLCDALEAMEAPSRCNDEPVEQMASESCAEMKVTDECKKEEKLRNDDVQEQPATEQIKEKSDEQTTEEEEIDEMEDASVVKYSVKTTPYLQSVRKSIHDGSTSKRKSNIKDLKFLTPVRRSSRIQRKSCHLPSMLVDHDPCVSSLAELVSLDDDLNAYIYRKNPALLEKLPDQPRM